MLTPKKDIFDFIKLRKKDANFLFTLDQICKYKIMFPKEAGGFDQISILVNEASRVTIYISEVYQYSDPVA